MFVAYSAKERRNVRIDNQYDLGEIFCCPNLNCPARFRIKSVTGKTAKHFARLKSTPHSPDCPFCTEYARYIDTDSVVTIPLERIFNGSVSQEKKRATSNGTSKRINSHGSKSVLTINTPNELYCFCAMNELDTPYCDGLLVRDIIVDERNLESNGLYKGFSGIRFVVGSVIFIDCNSRTPFLQLRAETILSEDKKHYLNLRVYLQSEFCNEVKKIIESSFDLESDKKVAVLGDWKTTKIFNIECTLADRKHLIILRDNLPDKKQL